MGRGASFYGYLRWITHLNGQSRLGGLDVMTTQDYFSLLLPSREVLSCEDMTKKKARRKERRGLKKKEQGKKGKKLYAEGALSLGKRRRDLPKEKGSLL